MLDKDGAVHGILSQRDDNHNAIFTRSDAILDFLGYYARRNGRDIACFKAPGERLPSNLLEPAPEPIGDSVVASLKPATRTLPATKTAPKVAPPSEPEADEIVIALPVRPSAGTFVSSASSRPAIRE